MNHGIHCTSQGSLVNTHWLYFGFMWHCVHIVFLNGTPVALEMVAVVPVYSHVLFVKARVG